MAAGTARACHMTSPPVLSGRVVFPALGNGPPETVAALPQQTPGPQRRMADPDRREAKAPVRQENRPWAAATAHPSL